MFVPGRLLARLFRRLRLACSESLFLDDSLLRLGRDTGQVLRFVRKEINETVRLDLRSTPVNFGSVLFPRSLCISAG